MIVPRYDIFYCNPSFPGFFSSSLFIHSLLIKYTRHIFRPPTYARRSDFRPFGRRPLQLPERRLQLLPRPLRLPERLVARHQRLPRRRWTSGFVLSHQRCPGRRCTPVGPPRSSPVRRAAAPLTVQQPRPPRSSPVRRAAAPSAATQPRPPRSSPVRRAAAAVADLRPQI